MKKFEYLIKENLYTNALNKLGQEGWELVSIVYVPTSYTKCFYFKREIIEKVPDISKSKSW